MTDDAAEVSLDSLERAAKALLARNEAQVRVFELEGCTFVFKPARAKSWESGRAWAAMLGCRLAFGEWVWPSQLRTGDIGLEAARLRELARAGCRVPTVVLQNDACLVLSYVGQSYDEIVEYMQDSERQALFMDVADDLAALHRRGCWHGGAQLRNVTRHPDGHLYRIDFEERHGYALSPTATRAYDALLYFGDALSHLAPHEVLPQGSAMLRRYLDQVDDPALPAAMYRLARLIRPLAWVDAHWPALTHKRKSQRIVRFARVVQAVLRA